MTFRGSNVFSPFNWKLWALNVSKKQTFRVYNPSSVWKKNGFLLHWRTVKYPKRLFLETILTLLDIYSTISIPSLIQLQVSRISNEVSVHRLFHLTSFYLNPDCTFPSLLYFHVPYFTLPTLPYPTLPYPPSLTLPYLFVPYLTYPTIPYPTLPYITLLFLPYPTLYHSTLPYFTLPYLILPYLTLPYPTLS